MHTPATTNFDVGAIDRPHPNLIKYYLIASLLAGPFYPIAALAGWLRYRTLRYQFDDEGVSMRWGILLRKDISLTFARLQDIHLESNAIERWLGLGRVQLQTASGSAKAEMVIEGLLEYEEVRNYLYDRMRGARGGATSTPSLPTATASADELAAVATALEATTRELAALRRLIESRASDDPGDPTGPSR